MDENKQTLNGPNGVKILLDKKQVFKDDPGNGTPAIVSKTVKGHEYTATYNCACGTGELDGRGGGISLTANELEWLNAQEDKIGDFLKW